MIQRKPIYYFQYKEPDSFVWQNWWAYEDRYNEGTFFKSHVKAMEYFKKNIEGGLIHQTHEFQLVIQKTYFEVIPLEK